MLSEAKHLCAPRDSPFAEFTLERRAQGDTRILPVLVVKIHTLRPSILLRCYPCLANTDDCISRILHFDLDRYIVPDGLCVRAESTHVRRRRNSEGVALDPGRKVNNAIRANGARRDARVRYDVQVRVTCPGRLQDRCRETPIRVSSGVHIDGGPDGRETSTKG